MSGGPSQFLRAWQAGRSVDVHAFPRPPLLEAVPFRLVVRSRADGSVVLADTAKSSRPAYWVLETHHPPTYYLPRDAVLAQLTPSSSARGTFCEWKGVASYHDVNLAPSGSEGANIVRGKVWSYEEPSNDRFAPIKGYVSFYALPEAWECSVDGEQVIAQPGDFYGGWMTRLVDGGAKGVKGPPGTRFW